MMEVADNIAKYYSISVFDVLNENADNLIALLLLINRNSIGNNELLDAGILNPLGCRVRQDTMGTASIYILGTQLHQSLGTLAERTGSINHIINHDAGVALYIANQVHNLGTARARTTPKGQPYCGHG